MKTLADVLQAIKIKPKEIHRTIGITGHWPRDQQLNILKGALKTGRFGDYSDPGTGKSLTSQLYLACITIVGRKTLLLMPPGLLRQYEKSLYEAMEFKKLGKEVHVLDQPPKKRKELYAKWAKDGWPDVLLVGYQLFLRDRDYLLKSKYDAIIADEAHYLKKASSKTHKLVKMFLKRGESCRFLPMTGSPVPTTPECAHGLISLVTPKTYMSKRMFDRVHLIKAQMGDFQSVVGFKNLDRLAKNLYLQAKRVLKEEVLDLEKPNIIPLEVTMSKSHRSVYNSLMNERLLEVDGDIIPAIQSQTLRRYAIQICSAPSKYTDKSVTNNTMALLDETLDSIGVVKYKKLQGKNPLSTLNKVIIFAHYQDTMDMLHDHLKDMNPAVLRGNTNANANKKKFIEDDTCRVAIIQPQSGGVGLDGFQHVCHNEIFFEPIGSPGMFDQCASRLIRSGQKRAVNVYVVVVKAPVFTKAVNVMLGRAKEVKTVVMKTSDLINELIIKM